ncbi:MAG: hypothetical protein ACP5Q1_09530 [Anaerolineae bacterium]
MFGLDTQFIIRIFGVTFAALGLAARLGLWKNWYWRSRGTVYGYIPLGLLFVLYSFNALAVARLGSYYVLYQGLFALLIACGLWWTVQPPAFIKPAWVRWIEAYPKDVYQMIEKAVESGADWEANVATPEKLEQWIKSLRSKKRRVKS